ncbi:hypothetical protein ACVBGC_16735 [Burkholderia stagnalis]
MGNDAAATEGSTPGDLGPGLDHVMPVLSSSGIAIHAAGSTGATIVAPAISRTILCVFRVRVFDSGAHVQTGSISGGSHEVSTQADPVFPNGI